MDFQSEFAHPRIIESLFRDAWQGLTLHHNRHPDERRPALSIEEARVRLERLLTEVLTYEENPENAPIADVFEDYQRLYYQLNTPECLAYLRETGNRYFERRKPEECSDKVWSYLVSLGYRGRRPTPLEARRLIAKFKSR